MSDSGFLYGVVLIYQTTAEGEYAPPRFSEEIVTVAAASEVLARQTAIKLGEASQESYRNTYGEMVRWRFLGVAAIQLLQTDRPEVGATLLSRSFDDLSRYRDLFGVTDGVADPSQT